MYYYHHQFIVRGVFWTHLQNSSKSVFSGATVAVEYDGRRRKGYTEMLQYRNQKEFHSALVANDIDRRRLWPFCYFSKVPTQN